MKNFSLIIFLIVMHTYISIDIGPELQKNILKFGICI